MRSSVLLAGVAAAVTGSVLLAQQNSTAPQPRPNALPAVAPAQPKFGRTVPRPEGLFYLVFIAPNSEWRDVEPMFQEMLRTVRFRGQ